MRSRRREQNRPFAVKSGLRAEPPRRAQSGLAADRGRRLQVGFGARLKIPAVALHFAVGDRDGAARKGVKRALARDAKAVAGGESVAPRARPASRAFAFVAVDARVRRPRRLFGGASRGQRRRRIARERRFGMIQIERRKRLREPRFVGQAEKSIARRGAGDGRRFFGDGGDGGGRDVGGVRRALFLPAIDGDRNPALARKRSAFDRAAAAADLERARFRNPPHGSRNAALRARDADAFGGQILQLGGRERKFVVNFHRNADYNRPPPSGGFF